MEEGGSSLRKDDTSVTLNWFSLVGKGFVNLTAADALDRNGNGGITS